MSNQICLAILASGNGTNLQAFIDAIDNGHLDAQIAVVLSDQPDAYALTRARQADIPHKYIGKGDYPSREAFEMELVEMIKKSKADLVILAGFMRILSVSFLSHFRGRVMNIHPSLLPAFRGLDAQKQALDYGVKVTGCTVHFVDEGMDTGPIILQAVVPVLKGDTRDQLAQRIQQKEHQIFPEAVRLFQQKSLKIEGRRVKISD